VSPLLASVPQPEAQEPPVRLQLTAVLGLPVPATCAVKVAVAPATTEALAGEIVTRTSLSSVTPADPLAVVSAWLVAAIVMETEEGSSEGAV